MRVHQVGRKKRREDGARPQVPDDGKTSADFAAGKATDGQHGDRRQNVGRKPAFANFDKRGDQRDEDQIDRYRYDTDLEIKYFPPTSRPEDGARALVWACGLNAS